MMPGDDVYLAWVRRDSVNIDKGKILFKHGKAILIKWDDIEEPVWYARGVLPETGKPFGATVAKAVSITKKHTQELIRNATEEIKSWKKRIDILDK